MRIFVSLCAVFFTFSLSASAQTPTPFRWDRYLFFAPGAGSVGDFSFGSNGRANIHVGAGGEAFIYKGLGVGAEIGPVIPWTAPSFSGGYRLSCCFGRLVGLGSANLSYHFLPNTADRKLEPFVVAGYSLFFRQGTWSGYNAGIGTNLWLKENVGMRFELRHHSSWAYKSMGFGMGVTFR